MATTIVTKYGGDAPAASDIVRGELAVDTENGRLYTENSSGAVVELGLNPEGNVNVTGTVTADGLTVDGVSTLTSNSSADGILLNGRSDNIGQFTFRSNDGATNYSQLQSRSTEMFVKTLANIPMSFHTNNTERLSIENNGDISFYEDTGTTPKFFWDASAESLGIGGAASDGTFQVKGTGVNTGITNVLIDASFADASNATGLTIGHRTDETTAVIAPRTGTGNLAFYNYDGGWSETMRLTNTGNVGIGLTTGISSKLHVNTEMSIGADADNRAIVGYTPSRFYIGTRQGGTNYFDTVSVSGGNLLVGTTSLTAIDNTPSTTGIGLRPSGSQMHSVGDGGNAVEFRINGTGAVGSINCSGSATSYNTSSDQRLKENIADADDAGSKIDSIQVRKFDWKADGSHQDYGMVAQELQVVAPEAVSAPEDPEEMMGVDYSKLVPMMLKEIQSLRARIAALES